ncbi:MAG: IPT/TIG domain-containing protein [Paludisphaera borealis]|uniref:IPT/TIG domain-containing protein n=1 Tax=Paludisphaera borealis TaxID=1387353 RepID=UPI0028516074|nr:IPT/TIG domain-containing protein [Paludisphaera borealis]MDR3618481.1 IPT/TIG domain-containing protein [Paludisphaera borealis]
MPLLHRTRASRSARRALRPQVRGLEPRLVPAAILPAASHVAAVARLVGEAASPSGGSGAVPSLAAQPRGTIQVGRAAGGEAIRILREGFQLSPLRPTRGRAAGPIVIGVTELSNRRIVQRLVDAYEAGQPVGVTNAGRNAAEWLRRRLNEPGAAVWDSGVPRASLVVFRNVPLDGGRTRPETTVLLPRESESRAGNHSASADRNVLDDLSAVFAPAPGAIGAPSSSSNLLDLANSYVTREIRSNDAGDAIQVVNTVVAARSFLNQADFYYVLQEVDYQAGRQELFSWYGGAVTTLTTPAKPPGLIQPSPQSTLDTTSITSGVETTIGGSIGFDQGSGFNASISGSIAISQSKTVAYAPVDVHNAVNLATGVAAWYFSVKDPQRAAGTTSTFFNQWIWQVPFTAYAEGQKSIAFHTTASAYKTNQVPIPAVVTTELTSTVPIPFGDTFALQAPRVASVDRSSVRAGSTFTITGSGLYPSLVTAVLIGGEPLAAGNYQSVSDTSITVVAPRTAGRSLPIVVQTSQGVSNDDVKITIKS